MNLKTKVTADDVARALGLAPFAEYERDARARLKARTHELGEALAASMLAEGRATGRTTRLMCQALALLRNEPTACVTWTAANTTIARRQVEDLRGYARAFGIKPRRIRHASRSARAGQPYVIRDHTADE